MTDDWMNERGNGAGGGRRAPAGAEQSRASDDAARRGLLAQVRVLTELRHRAAPTFAARPCADFSGFAELLDTFLPGQAEPDQVEALTTFAALVRLPLETLNDLRNGTVPASSVASPERIVAVALALQIDRSTCLELVRRDLQRRLHADAHGAAGPRRSAADVAAEIEERLRGLQAAWDRAGAWYPSGGEMSP